MVQYDSNIIQQMADGLYRQARWMEFNSAMLGAFVGGAAFAGGAVAADIDMAAIAGAAGVLFGAIGGFSRGRAKAFTLRLQAQTALCQMQIERNTSVR